MRPVPWFTVSCVLAWSGTAPLAAQDVPPRAPHSVFAYDRDQPLDVRRGSTTEEDGVRTVDLSYASPGGGRVPGYLFVPNGARPFAGIVLLHGMPGNRRNSLTLGQRYARTGAVVLAITAPFARPEDNPRRRPITLTDVDRVEQIQLMQDLQRAVDLLIAHPLVDSARIGFSGGSYGAAMGGLFAGVERRVKAYALWVGDGGLVAHVSGEDDRGGRFDRLPETQKAEWRRVMLPIEPIRFVGEAAPAALFFQSARNDRAVMVADAERFSAAGSEPKVIRWYDTGHGLNAEAFREQAEWMATQLGLHITRWR